MKYLLIAFSLISFSKPVFSWGEVGHRIVGEIATQYMNPTALANMKKLIGRETLADASVWADDIRSDTVKSAELARRYPAQVKTKWPTKEDKKDARIIAAWHYVTIPDGQTYESSKKNPQGDIIVALKNMEKTLKNNKSSIKEKREALRLFAHYVGDIHQPLHVGTGLDIGGNGCWVNWFPEKYPKSIEPRPEIQNKDYRKLHSIWDSDIIEGSHLSYTEYSKKLIHANPDILSDLNDFKKEKLEEQSMESLQKIFSQKIKQWQKSSFVDWANESVSFRKDVYIGKEIEEGSSKRKYCSKSYKVLIKHEDIPNFGYSQIHKAKRIINYRLLQAGIRLAGKLNTIFN